MNGQDHELMKRYIYQVTRRLPKAQRNEISLELEELITDMYESGNGSMRDVLIKLGEPKEFAKKYQNDNHCLIGPDNYDNYIWVLKIVMVCVGISAIVSTIFNMKPDIANVGTWIADFIADLITNLLTSGFGAFGFITLIFAIIDHNQSGDAVNAAISSVKAAGSDKEQKKHSWNPDDLKEVPDKKMIINRGDTVAGIIFTMFFCALLVFAPQVLGAYHKDANGVMQNIPLFNLQKWGILCPLLVASLFAGFIDEIIKLLTGCYNYVVMVGNIITNMISIVLCVIIFKMLPVWNMNFANDVSNVYNIHFDSTGDLMSYWGTPLISNIVVAVICAFCILEMVITIYKTLRYTNKATA